MSISFIIIECLQFYFSSMAGIKIFKFVYKKTQHVKIEKGGDLNVITR